jgi:hypothetical protein
MLQKNKCFKFLRSLGLEFWLFLPLLGIAFWVGGGFVMDRVLSRPDLRKQYLKGDAQLARKSETKVVSIKAEINHQENFSTVTVGTASSVLKELVFQFPVTQPSEIEDAISKTLGLPREEVSKRVLYSTVDNN